MSLTPDEQRTLEVLEAVTRGEPCSMNIESVLDAYNRELIYRLTAKNECWWCLTGTKGRAELDRLRNKKGAGDAEG